MRFASCRAAFVAALLSAFLVSSVSLGQTDRELIAVLDLEPIEASGAETTAISEKLREELLKTGRFNLVERERLNQVMEEQALQQANCVGTECAAQVGRFLGVSKIVTGRVTKLSSASWQVSASLVDVQTAQTIRVESVLHEGSLVTLLRQGVRELGVKLTGTAAPAPITPESVTKTLPADGQTGSAAPVTTPFGMRVYLAPIDAGGVTLDYKNSEGDSVTDDLSGSGFTFGADYFLSKDAVVFLFTRYGTFDEWERTTEGSSTTLTAVSGSYMSLAGGVDLVFSPEGPGRFLLGIGLYNTWASFEGKDESAGVEHDGDATIFGLLLDIRGDYTFQNGLFIGAGLQFKSGIARGSTVDGDSSAGGSGTHVFFPIGYSF